jgi:hypothetical protein
MPFALPIAVRFFGSFAFSCLLPLLPPCGPIPLPLFLSQFSIQLAENSLCRPIVSPGHPLLGLLLLT